MLTNIFLVGTAAIFVGGFFVVAVMAMDGDPIVDSLAGAAAGLLFIFALALYRKGQRR